MNTVTEQPMMPVALRYGLIGGLAAIVLTLVAILAGQMTNPVVSGLGMLIYPIIAYLAIKTLRTAQGEHISFGKALGVGVIACALVGLLSGIFQYVYFNFIDPSAMEEVINASVEMMESFGAGEDAIEQAVEGMKDGYTPVQTILGGLGGGAFFGLIVSLIAGAIMKKEAPINV